MKSFNAPSETENTTLLPFKKAEDKNCEWAHNTFQTIHEVVALLSSVQGGSVTVALERPASPEAVCFGEDRPLPRDGHRHSWRKIPPWDMLASASKDKCS